MIRVATPGGEVRELFPRSNRIRPKKVEWNFGKFDSFVQRAANFLFSKNLTDMKTFSGPGYEFLNIVTRLGNLLDLGQLFKAFGKN